MLTLPIKKKWFDMIRSGEKKEEYREIKPYYTNRFFHNDQLVNGEAIREVAFRNGYAKDSPIIKCKVRLSTGPGKTEWGAVAGEIYYRLHILEVSDE